MTPARARRPVAPRGERKLVSVLFVDLTGYTALSATLDPEEVYRFLTPGVHALRRIVEEHGGTVPQIMGDGFMAVFGVPAAHEDDEERAVRAALAVRDHVANLNAGRTGIAFPAVHAGVNSGEVMVAPSFEASGFAVIGDTVNTASRLADAARGGTILVDERTHERTSDAIRYGPRRLLSVKGKESLPAYEALGVRAAGPRRPSPTTAFVDRVEAIERVRAEIRAAEHAHRSSVLLVTGEAGSGKSRLAAELRRRRIARVLIGRCPAFGRALPLHALGEAVGSGLGVAPGAPASAVEEAARSLGSDGGAKSRAERSAFVRDLRLLLGSEPLPRGQARRSVHDAARAARTAIEALARRRAVVVAIDDLHLADPDLLRFLRDVERDPWPAPVLFLGLGRPASGLPRVSRMELGLLGRDDLRELARSVLGEASAEAVDETVARAGGNPLFLEETLGMLVEAGALARRGAVWEVADRERLRTVPSSIRRLIAARLDGLPEEEKAVLQDAAVAGDAATDRLLERLADGADVVPLIRSLLERGLLVRREPSPLPDAHGFEVKHLLVRDVAYESVPRGERAETHLAIAQWLRGETGGVDEPVALLAHHYERAWELSRSKTGPAPRGDVAAMGARYLRVLAERTFAYQAREAASVYGRAIDLARAAGDEAGDEADPAEVADLLIGRAESLIEMGRHREALADATEARATAERLRDDRRRARALLALGRTESDLGRSARARRLLEEARRLFAGVRDVRGQAWALHRRSETWSSADYRREVEDLEECYRLFGRARDRWGRSVAVQDLAYILSARGGRSFDRWFERAARLAEDERDLRSQAALARTGGYASFYRGELTRAAREMAEARPLAARAGDRYAEADAIVIQAMCEAAIGPPATAERLMEEVLALAEELRSARLHVLGLLVGARSAVRLGQAALASRRLGSARRLIERHRQWVTGVELHATDAWTRLDRGAFAGIGAVVGRATTAAGRHGLDMFAPLGPLIRARAAIGSGDLGRARRDLRLAGELSGELGATGYARLAEALEGELALLRGEGAPMPPRRGVAREAGSADPEVEATDAEREGLVALRAGALDRAGARFEAAAAAWEPMGSTVWLARALAFGSEIARAAGDPSGRRRGLMAASAAAYSPVMRSRLRSSASDVSGPCHVSTSSPDAS